MTPTFYINLTLQICVVLVAALYYRNKIPLILLLLTVSIYITMPLGILLGGIASAFYAIDLMLPIMIFFSLMHNARGAMRMLSNKLFLFFCLLLLVVPMVNGSILFLIGHDIFAYDGFKSHLIWFYRNIVLVLVFGIAVISNPSKDQLRSIIEMNIVLGLCLAVAGVVNYFGPFNLSFFEMILTGNDPNGYLANNRVGAGFMGLFRGSVGQWFAILGIIALGSYNFVSKKIKKLNVLLFVLSITVVLLSFSRAGIVGLATGVFIIVFSTRKNRLVYSLILAVSLVFVGYLMTNDQIGERFSFSVKSGYFEEDSAIQSRIEGWKLSLFLISEQPSVFLFGVAPANDQLVYEKIGLYGSHNEYLNTFVKSGVIEFLLLIFVLIYMVKIAKMKFSKTEDIKLKSICIMVISIIIANIVMSLTQSHLLQSHATYTCAAFIYLLYGVFLGKGLKTSTSRRFVPVVTLAKRNNNSIIIERCSI